MDGGNADLETSEGFACQEEDQSDSWPLSILQESRAPGSDQRVDLWHEECFY